MKLFTTSPKLCHYRTFRWLAAITLGLFSLATTHAEVPKLTVQGNKVLVGGQQKSLGGNSLFWSNDGWGGERFYNADVVRWLKNDWQTTIVRAAMGINEGGGYLSNPASNKARVRAVVDAAIANDQYVIIDWHSHHAEDQRDAAVAFFREMAQLYGHRNHVIYEVYNEPLQVSWTGVIKPYAEAIIAAIRQHDPDNLIIVGTPNWSQLVDEASLSPIAGNNIAYTLHFYAGTHGQWLRDKARTALNNGIALFVTEWGTVDASGDGAVNHTETDAWVAFMRQNKIHHANWALNDKNEGASALPVGASNTGGWTALTPSGNKVRDIVRSSDKLGDTPPPPPPGCSTASSVGIPAQIQAENFCEQNGVQTENTSDTGGGSNIGWIDSGDWLAYKINVPTAGRYEIAYRVASLAGGGQLQIEKQGGTPAYGNITVPQTNGWQVWTTIKHTIQLDAGTQTIALAALTGGFNLNWFEIKNVDVPPPFAITLQAENFAQQSGTQTESTSDVGGGLNVGWIDRGDWLSYPSITLPQAGNYTVEYRVASLNGGGRLQLERAGGSTVFGQMNIAATGGWQNWTTVKHTVQLPAGELSLGIAALEGGWNLNWIKISSGDQSGWQLVWSDEFNGSQIDSAKWVRETGGGGWGNNELQYYTNRSENARIENGKLIIEARREAYGGRDYTSARLKTQGLHSWKFGRIEARVKLPRGQGMWPALWMLGDNLPSVGWPQCGEIDILENVGYETQRIFGTIHGPNYSGANGFGGAYRISSGHIADAFHVVAVEWVENEIRWFVDGQRYHTATPANVNGQWVFDHNFFLILNLAIGGNWPGNPDSSTVLPQRYEIDYVRVYKRT